MLHRVSIAVSFAVLVFASHAHAQTAQRWSIQLSALGVELTSVTNDELRFGGGIEFQGRYNPGALSIGFGFQTTRHTLENQLLARDVTVTYTGGFVEPRLILGSIGDFAALYGSVRFMSLSAKFDVAGGETKVEGAAISGGGGLLIRLTSRLNAEVGATAGKEYYNRDAGDGTTIVTRFGLAYGL
mgnify:CR=1 FL=1